jgi:NAD(P)-dependent dehydrogenase (short-subunit alcohol dehydrogenase family)
MSAGIPNAPLAGRVAVVTGASREIGAAMAEALAMRGAAVVVGHYDEAELAESVVARIRSAGGRAVAENGDLSRIADNRRLVERAVTEFGRVDIFAANAGLVRWVPFLEVDEPTWDEVVDLNLKGSFFGAQVAARQMVAQRTAAEDDGYGGRIVFSSSVTGIRTVPNLSAYAVTKAALRHMATVLAVELGRYGITVNALEIGATVNARNLRDDPSYERHWARVIPTGRAVQPVDLAAALAFLASDEAAMVTGHTLTVDGGWSGVGHVPSAGAP